MQGGGGAAAALGIGGNWDQNTFPKEYHAKPANRAPPDAGQMLKNARHDPNMPAVGACTAASGPASPPARAPLNSDQQLSSLRLTDTSYRRARRARPGEMLQQAERELAQKQLELDRLAQEMGEQGSRGIVAGHFGRNATTQAASHTGGVAATYLNREAGEPSSRDGGGGSGGGGAGRVAGVRDDKGGQGGVAGFDTMDLKREGLGHNFGRVNRMREPESDAGKALNHVVRARPLQTRSGLPSTSMRFFLSLTAKCFRSLFCACDAGLHADLESVSRAAAPVARRACRGKRLPRLAQLGSQPTSTRGARRLHHRRTGERSRCSSQRRRRRRRRRRSWD